MPNGDQEVFLSAKASTLGIPKVACLLKSGAQTGRGFGTPVSDQQTKRSRLVG